MIYSFLVILGSGWYSRPIFPFNQCWYKQELHFIIYSTIPSCLYVMTWFLCLLREWECKHVYFAHCASLRKRKAYIMWQLFCFFFISLHEFSLWGLVYMCISMSVRVLMVIITSVKLMLYQILVETLKLIYICESIKMTHCNACPRFWSTGWWMQK